MKAEEDNKGSMVKHDAKDVQPRLSQEDRIIHCSSPAAEEFQPIIKPRRGEYQS